MIMKNELTATKKLKVNVKKPQEKLPDPYKAGITIKGLSPATKFSVADYLKAHNSHSSFLSLFNK